MEGIKDFPNSRCNARILCTKRAANLVQDGFDLGKIRNPAFKDTGIGGTKACDPCLLQGQIAFDNCGPEMFAYGQARYVLPCFGEAVGFFKEIRCRYHMFFGDICRTGCRFRPGPVSKDAPDGRSAAPDGERLHDWRGR